jgi:hypothetical protein
VFAPVIAYRDKKVVGGVFVLRFRAPLQARLASAKRTANPKQIQLYIRGYPPQQKES